jgi:hypothetical protein
MIKLLQDWNGHLEGSVLTDIAGGVADILVVRGIAKYEIDQENKSDNAPVESGRRKNPGKDRGKRNRV